MDTFDMMWQRILRYEGAEFKTKTGLPFTYRIDGSQLIPDRTGYPLHVSQFRLAYGQLPLRGPSEINNLVRGPAYIYAILTDARTMP
jgi:hypothetical protein